MFFYFTLFLCLISLRLTNDIHLEFGNPETVKQFSICSGDSYFCIFMSFSSSKSTKFSSAKLSAIWTRGNIETLVAVSDGSSGFKGRGLNEFTFDHKNTPSSSTCEVARNWSFGLKMRFQKWSKPEVWELLKTLRLRVTFCLTDQLKCTWKLNWWAMTAF